MPSLGIRSEWVMILNLTLVETSLLQLCGIYPQLLVLEDLDGPSTPPGMFGEYGLRIQIIALFPPVHVRP